MNNETKKTIYAEDVLDAFTIAFESLENVESYFIDEFESNEIARVMSILSDLELLMLYMKSQIDRQGDEK